MPTMSKPQKKPAPNPAKGGKPPVLYIRPTHAHEAALQAYIAAQDTPPERTTVAVRALEHFLEARGFWPPKPT